MKNLLRIAIVFALGVGSANAAWFTARIDRMQIAPNGSFAVYFSQGVNTECGSNRIDFTDTTLPGFKYIFAALLEYEAQKDYVQFLILSCSGTTGIFHNIEGSVGV